MPDKFAPSVRSAIMARVRSTGNASTEGRLIQLMKAGKITGWRRHAALTGRPDFVFRGPPRVAVFVDGCFWHGCPRCGRMPASRREYWTAKITRNQRRDRAVSRQLRQAGWRVLRLRECALRECPGKALARLRRALNFSPPTAEKFR